MKCEKFIWDRIPEEYKNKLFHKRLDGIVYLVEAYGLFKIGYTTNFKKRIQSLSTQMPCPLKVIFYLTVNQAKKMESTLHLAFKDKRKHGEWFQLSPQEIRIIQSYISKEVT